MCEIPNNIIQFDAFSQCFDGFSIDSNDLIQLSLGVDRDSAILAADFDEHDPGVNPGTVLQMTQGILQTE
jgi:pyruvate, water dikinase